MNFFKLQVVLGDDGEATELVGLYDDGRRDVSPRDETQAGASLTSRHIGRGSPMTVLFGHPE